jgi:hypothetical protein
MTGQEITNQIITDLESSVKAQNETRSNAQIMTAITAEGMDPRKPSSHSIAESWVALSCEFSLPTFVMTLVHIINWITTIAKIDEGDKLSIRGLLDIFTNNQQNIAEAIQHIKDNRDLKFVTGNSVGTLFEFLMDRINVVHEEAESIRRAHKAFLEGK